MTVEQLWDILGDKNDRRYTPKEERSRSRLPANYIKDPDKSVNWNIQYVQQYNAECAAIPARNEAARKEKEALFRRDLREALKTSYGVNDAQVTLLIHDAERSRSYGYGQMLRHACDEIHWYRQLQSAEDKNNGGYIMGKVHNTVTLHLYLEAFVWGDLRHLATLTCEADFNGDLMDCLLLNSSPVLCSPHPVVGKTYEEQEAAQETGKAASMVRVIYPDKLPEFVRNLDIASVCELFPASKAQLEADLADEENHIHDLKLTYWYSLR